jgi:hypothetical protein
MVIKQYSKRQLLTQRQRSTYLVMVSSTPYILYAELCRVTLVKPVQMMM